MKTNLLVITNTATNTATNVGTNAPANDIHALKPPVDIPNPWLYVWISAGALLLAAVIALLLRWWQKKREEIVVVPPIPPHLRARARLNEALALMDQPGPFCIMVSDITRRYLEERFNFHAPERTTEEFLRELQASDLLLEDQKQSLAEFLSVCDMVKFARYEPGPAELKALHDSAVRLVDETEPPPPAASAANS